MNDSTRTPEAKLQTLTRRSARRAKRTEVRIDFTRLQRELSTRH